MKIFVLKRKNEFERYLSLYFSIKLIQFERFEDTTNALAAITATIEGKLSKPLKKLLKSLNESETEEKLLVADSALGKSIKVCYFSLSY